jgi:uncharacterized membrane protein YoaK (UPF0700 family)
LWFALLLTLTNGFMDAHTYYVMGGVFANVQTGNVIFFAIDMSERKITAAMAHVWPILAFMVGMALAAHIKSGRVERFVPHPLRWTMTVRRHPGRHACPVHRRRAGAALAPASF